MKEYQVQIVYTERYSVYVEADDEDTAVELAEDMFNNGQLESESASISADILWAEEDDECDE